jgi:hypothetical protein
MIQLMVPFFTLMDSEFTGKKLSGRRPTFQASNSVVVNLKSSCSPYLPLPRTLRLCKNLRNNIGNSTEILTTKIRWKKTNWIKNIMENMVQSSLSFTKRKNLRDDKCHDKYSRKLTKIISKKTMPKRISWTGYELKLEKSSTFRINFSNKMIITVGAIINSPPLEIMVIKQARHQIQMIGEDVIKRTKKNSHHDSKIKVAEGILLTVDREAVTKVLIKTTRKAAIKTLEIVTMATEAVTEVAETITTSSQSRWFQIINSNTML